MFKDKWIVIGTVITIVLVVGGIFYFTKTPTTPETQSAPVSMEILLPSDSHQTGGLVNDTYMAATPSAKITIVEFGDFQCPACGVYQPLFKQLLIDFPGQINFGFRNFPLSQHANAEISSLAAEAAGIQGKYWQMYDKIYESQKEWSDSSDAKSIFIGYATTLGLNLDQFKEDIESSKLKDKIKRDVKDGTLVNIRATPTYFLNGVKMENIPSSYTQLKSLISDKLSN